MGWNSQNGHLLNIAILSKNIGKPNVKKKISFSNVSEALEHKISEAKDARMAGMHANSVLSPHNDSELRSAKAG